MYNIGKFNAVLLSWIRGRHSCDPLRTYILGVEYKDFCSSMYSQAEDSLMSNETPPNYIELAADIVSAFVSNNSVSVSDLPSLIGNVHAALQNAGQPAAKQDEA